MIDEEETTLVMLCERKVTLENELTEVRKYLDWLETEQRNCCVAIQALNNASVGANDGDTRFWKTDNDGKSLAQIISAEEADKDEISESLKHELAKGLTFEVLKTLALANGPMTTREVYEAVRDGGNVPNMRTNHDSIVSALLCNLRSRHQAVYGKFEKFRYGRRRVWTLAPHVKRAMQKLLAKKTQDIAPSHVFS